MLSRLFMRLAAAVIAASASLTSLAHANPITAGISAGVLHDKDDADGEGNRTLGLFGRVGLTKLLSGQLEVMKIDTDEATWTPTTIRTATLSVRLDLVDHGRLIPTIAFGAGIDRASTDYDTTEGHHFEGGFGLEYRADGGFTIGADLRFGGRSVEDQVVAQPVREGDVKPLIYDGGGLRDGEYRALRVTAGITF